MLSGFGPEPLLQAGAAWHSPPASLQLSVVIEAVPDQYTLSLICGGGVGLGLGLPVKLNGTLASKSVRLTTLVNNNAGRVRRSVPDEGNFLIMRVN